MRVFYDHLVLIQEVIVELDQHDLDLEEREELIELIDQTVHHSRLDLILSSLPQNKHREFISKFQAAPYDMALLEYLRVDTPDIETRIKNHAGKLKSDLRSEIHKSRRKKR